MEKTSSNSIRVSTNWVMTSGSQPGPWKSNEISRRCADSLRQTCRKSSCWLTFRRSSKEGSGSKSADVGLAAPGPPKDPLHRRGGQRGPRRPVWGRGQPSVASRGPVRSYEVRRGCRGSTPRCCRHRIRPMRQALEGGTEQVTGFQLCCAR